jgi:hypothetical protein
LSGIQGGLGAKIKLFQTSGIGEFSHREPSSITRFFSMLHFLFAKKGEGFSEVHLFSRRFIEEVGKATVFL